MLFFKRLNLCREITSLFVCARLSQIRIKKQHTLFACTLLRFKNMRYQLLKLCSNKPWVGYQLDGMGS